MTTIPDSLKPNIQDSPTLPPQTNWDRSTRVLFPNPEVGTSGVPEVVKPELYILWNPSSGQPPRKVYSTYEEARLVAQTMVRNHGGTFLVMKAVLKVEVRPEPLQETPL